MLLVTRMISVRLITVTWAIAGAAASLRGSKQLVLDAVACPRHCKNDVKCCAVFDTFNDAGERDRYVKGHEDEFNSMSWGEKLKFLQEQKQKIGQNKAKIGQQNEKQGCIMFIDQGGGSFTGFVFDEKSHKQVKCLALCARARACICVYVCLCICVSMCCVVWCGGVCVCTGSLPSAICPPICMNASRSHLYCVAVGQGEVKRLLQRTRPAT